MKPQPEFVVTKETALRQFIFKTIYIAKFFFVQIRFILLSWAHIL